MNYFHVYICDMKIIEKKRTYRMSERAEQVARNDQKILDATSDLWLEVSLPELTLEKVAQNSGVTVRTILRKFGSREGLIKACIENSGLELSRKRMEVTPGDLTGILDILLEEYEAMGNALIRTLTVEYDFPSTKELLVNARSIHRDWCAYAFAPFLPSNKSEDYETVLSAFIAVTEFYLWKLLRKDLGKSPEECRQVFRLMLDSLVSKSKIQ